MVDYIDWALQATMPVDAVFRGDGVEAEEVFFEWGLVVQEW